MNKSRTTLIATLLIIFIAMCIFFITESVGDLTFIAPAILFAVLSVLIGYFLLLETVIGYKTYGYEMGCVTVQRKCRTIAVIQKEQIERLVIFYDTTALKLDNKKEIHYFKIYHGGKSYAIEASRFPEEALKELIRDIRYEEKTNSLYYLLRMFS